MTVFPHLRQARYEQACWWLEHGVAVVPLKPCSKHLQPGYGPRQAQIATNNLARQWFLNTDANLGIVLGGAAGIAVADWDDAWDYQTWHDGLGAALDTRVEQTGRGYHVFFFGVQFTLPIRSERCEFKASGVCMVSPSRHPSGVVYRIVSGATIMPLSKEKALRLFPFLSEPPNLPAPPVVSEDIVHHPTQGLARDNSLVVRIKLARKVEDEIRASGVELRHAGPHEWVGLCPFQHGTHKDRHPSLWVNTLRQRWGCYAPGCESNRGGQKAHDVVNYRALSRGLTNTVALKQLAEEFLPAS